MDNLINIKSNELKSVSVRKSIKRAIKCMKCSEFGKSCAHFCIAFKLSFDSNNNYNEVTAKWKSTFLYAFDRHIHHLETIGEKEAVITAFDAAISAVPDCEDLHYNKGLYFYKKDCLSDAVSCFQSSLELNPNYNLSHLCLENIKSSSIPRWHYIMINDIQRNTAFKTAISIAVNKGYNTVLDIGSGSGLLSLYCVESGAHKVYGCEVSQMLFYLCRDVLQINGVSDKVILFNKMSTDLCIPQMIEKPISLVVTEIFDASLFGEHVLSTIYSALKSLLDPNHRLVVPKRAVVYGVLIESEELRNMFRLKGKQFGNTIVSNDVSVCVDFNQTKYTTINLSKVDKQYLSQRFEIIDIDFNDISQIEQLLDSDYVFNIDVKCQTEGKLDAIGVWFDLHLIDDIHISTEPPTPLIGWEQAIYPTTPRPYNVSHKTEVKLSFSLNEDYLKLIDLKLNPNHSLSQNKVIQLNSDLIKYLNANNIHQKYMNAIQEVICIENIANLIDLNYFPISSLNFIDSQFLDHIFLVTEDTESEDNINKLFEISNLKMTQKISLLNFDEMVASNTSNQKCLVVSDFIESSGLIRSNVLEKLAYFQLYSPIPPIYIPFRIVFKGLIIQSNDLLIRSRLISDNNVHGFKIKNLLNVFETEILQNIDLKKLEFSELSNCFDLLEINLNQLFKSKDEINFEPQNQCSVKVVKSGQIDAVLYWYELHLTQQIVISSLDLGTEWHSTAFVVKEPIDVKPNDIMSISSLFTNGFLRFNGLKIE